MNKTLMKNSLKILSAISLIAIGYFIIKYIVSGGISDPTHQIPIVVAIASIFSQIIVLLIKPFLDDDLNRNNKTFNVLHDKKFEMYNSIYNQIFLAKRDIIPHLKRKLDQGDLEIVYNSLSELKRLCILSRLFMSKELYELLEKLNMRLYFAYTNKDKINDYEGRVTAEKLGELYLKNTIDLNYFSTDILFTKDIEKIEKIMRKELHIN